MKKRRKRQLLALVVVIILVLVASYSYVRWGRGGGVLYITVLKPTETEDSGGDVGYNGIDLVAEITPRSDSELDGSVKITITYAETDEVVYSKSEDIKYNDKKDRNYIEKSISYEDFVMGNGDYIIKVSSDGKSDKETYNVNFVAEDLNATVRFPETLEFEVRTNSRDVEDGTAIMYWDVRCLLADGLSPRFEPRALTLEVDAVAPNGAQDSITLEEPGLLDNWFFDFTMPYLAHGWNTFDMTLTQDVVSPDSPYREVTVQHREYIDAYPVAVGDDDLEGSLRFASEVTVDLDASESYDDSGISMYSWFLEDDLENHIDIFTDSIFDQYDGEDNDGDGVIDEEGETTDGKFDGKTTITLDSRGKYTVYLTVLDNYNPKEKDITKGEVFQGHPSDKEMFIIEIGLQ